MKYFLTIEITTIDSLNLSSALRDWQESLPLWLSTHKNYDFGRQSRYETYEIISVKKEGESS